MIEKLMKRSRAKKGGQSLSKQNSAYSQGKMSDESRHKEVPTPRNFTKVPHLGIQNKQDPSTDNYMVIKANSDDEGASERNLSKLKTFDSFKVPSGRLRSNKEEDQGVVQEKDRQIMVDDVELAPISEAQLQGPQTSKQQSKGIEFSNQTGSEIMKSDKENVTTL